MSHEAMLPSGIPAVPTEEQLAGELRFQVVGRLDVHEAPRAAAKRSVRLPWASIALLAVIALGCLLANVIAPGDANYMDLASPAKAPCTQYPFGTDMMGRSIFAMIWHGGRVSLLIGVLATALSTAIAVVYGTVSGAGPVWLDTLMMRVTEIFLSVPSLLIVIFLQAILGPANVVSISVVLGVTSWPTIAKVVRTEVRQLRQSEYVVASRCMGGGFMHVLVNHFAPNFLSSIMFMVVMNVRGAIASESTLSFMGLGLPLDIVSWGSMLSGADRALLTGAWWIILIPGLFLVATLVCMTNIGNALRGEVNRGERNL
jgi:peptide/nickel transport system permease protein